jgi:hypothetical protein
MVCTPIYSFSAPEGKYLESATSSHLIEAEGYEICPYFIPLARELNFVEGLDENPYKHLQDFTELCATLMISGMIHETLEWKVCASRPSWYVSVINDNHLVSLMNFNEAKEN